MLTKACFAEALFDGRDMTGAIKKLLLTHKACLFSPNADALISFRGKKKC